jgi:hypothetical protein
VSDSATGLAGLASKLLVLSSSRLSFTQTAKQAKFFCCSFTVHKTSQKEQKIQMGIISPKNVYHDSGLDVRSKSEYDGLSIP